MTFLPSLPLLATFTIACILLAITPGPDMTLFLSRTMAGGRKLGFAAMLGATTGLVFHALLAGFGLSALIAASPNAFLVIKIVGALYLLFLAVQAIRHGSALSIKREGAVEPSVRATYLTGIGINLTNPKIIIFYVTFLPQFVEAGDPFASGKLLFLALYFLVLGTIIGFILIVIAAQFISTMRANPKAMRIFDYSFAALMGGFAVKLLTAQGR